MLVYNVYFHGLGPRTREFTTHGTMWWHILRANLGHVSSTTQFLPNTNLDLGLSDHMDSRVHNVIKQNAISQLRLETRLKPKPLRLQMQILTPEYTMANYAIANVMVLAARSDTHVSPRPTSEGSSTSQLVLTPHLLWSPRPSCCSSCATHYIFTQWSKILCKGKVSSLMVISGGRLGNRCKCNLGGYNTPSLHNTKARRARRARRSSQLINLVTPKPCFFSQPSC